MEGRTTIQTAPVVNAISPVSMNASGSLMAGALAPGGARETAGRAGAGLTVADTAKSAVDSAGNAYLAGWYRTPTTFGTNVLQTNGFWNYFIAKLAGPTFPLQFGSLSVSNGTFAMRLNGSAGAGVIVDTSFNLTNWTPWQTNTLPAGGLDLVLPMGTNHQFFRARLP